MQFKLSSKEKEELWNELRKRDGTKCHYCSIEEKDFSKVWGEAFYGGIKRGRILEIDRIDNNRGYCIENCVLACALCNMSKSDKFDYEEFKRVGGVIREIWQRKSGVPKRPPVKE